MKKLILVFAIVLFVLPTSARSKDSCVSLVAMGQASTRDDALLSAFRSAIEQSYGTFISSRTSILNDNLISDEITSVSSGNIKRYTILSESFHQSIYYITINAEVSLTKLANFAERHGQSCDFNGDLLLNNIKLMRFRADNTAKCIENLTVQLNQCYSEMFTFNVQKVESPIFSEKDARYYFPVEFSCDSNEASDNIAKLVCSTIMSLTLNDQEITDYKNYTGVTPLEEFGILPGDLNTELASLVVALRRCLYDITIQCDGTSASSSIKFIYNAFDFKRESPYNVALVCPDKILVQSGYGMEPSNWGYIHSSIGNSEESFFSKQIYVYQPIYYTDDYKRYSDFGEDEFCFRFQNWYIEKRNKVKTVYKIRVYVPLTERQLRTFTGVSIFRN